MHQNSFEFDLAPSIELFLKQIGHFQLYWLFQIALRKNGPKQTISTNQMNSVKNELCAANCFW